MCVCTFLAAFSMKPEQKFELWACDEQTHACVSVCVTLSFSLTQRKPIHTCPHTLMWWQGTVAGMCQDWMIAKHTWGTVLPKGKHSHIWVLNSISLVGCVRQRPHWGTWDRPCLQLYWTGAGSSAGAPPSKASASSHCLLAPPPPRHLAPRARLQTDQRKHRQKNKGWWETTWMCSL